MKKFLTIFTSLILALTLTACSSNSDNTSSSDVISSETNSISSNSESEPTQNTNSDIISSEDTSSDDTSSSSDNSAEIIETYNDTINHNATNINLDNCYEYFLEPIYMSLKFNWGNEEDYQLYTEDNLIFLKADLESLYYMQNNSNIYDDNGYVLIKDYSNVISTYFNFDASLIEIWLRNTNSYNPETESTLMSDGLGSIIEIKPLSFKAENNFITIQYSIGTSKDDTTIGTLIIELEDNDFKYISNSNNFLSLVN